MRQKSKLKNKHNSRPGVFKQSRWLSVIFLCLTFITLLTIRLYVDQPITGDEPHYLLMDYSLIHDHDLDLKNNFTNRDYWGFYPNAIEPQTQVGRDQVATDAPSWYSIHGIGLPILLLPAVFLAGKLGAAITMVVVATVVIWLTWVWTSIVTNNKKLAVAAAASLLISYFFNGLAGYLYPDMVIAALTLAALIILERYFDRLLYQTIFGLILGSLVLFHFKALAIAGPLLLIMVYKLWRHKRKIPWVAIGIFFAVVGCFLLSIHAWFGVWNPTDIYAAEVNLQTSPVRTVSAMLFDSMRGLLVYNPFLLLIFIGLPIWFKKRRGSLGVTLATVVPSIVLLTTFNQWQGGDSPTGRYIMGFLPVFVPAIALALEVLRHKWQKAVVALLLLATFFIALDATVTKRMYVRSDTRSPLFARIERYTNLAPDRLLPTFSNNTALTNHYGVPKILIGYLLLLTLIYYGFLLSKSSSSRGVNTKPT